jgi:hypothetical protein
LCKRYFYIFIDPQEDQKKWIFDYLFRPWGATMEGEEKEQIIREEDEYGNIIAYPAWSKKNAPRDQQNKWEVPIYL